MRKNIILISLYTLGIISAFLLPWLHTSSESMTGLNILLRAYMTNDYVSVSEIMLAIILFIIGVNMSSCKW